jgi:hypothetical protein
VYNTLRRAKRDVEGKTAFVVVAFTGSNSGVSHGETHFPGVQFQNLLDSQLAVPKRAKHLVASSKGRWQFAQRVEKSRGCILIVSSQENPLDRGYCPESLHDRKTEWRFGNSITEVQPLWNASKRSRRCAYGISFSCCGLSYEATESR